MVYFDPSKTQYYVRAIVNQYQTHAGTHVRCYNTTCRTYCTCFWILCVPEYEDGDEEWWPNQIQGNTAHNVPLPSLRTAHCPRVSSAHPPLSVRTRGRALLRRARAGHTRPSEKEVPPCPGRGAILVKHHTNRPVLCLRVPAGVLLRGHGFSRLSPHLPSKAPTRNLLEAMHKFLSSHP